MAEIPTFRAPKRRRVNVKELTRHEEDGHTSDEESGSLLVKAKKQAMNKRGGVQFSNTRQTAHEEDIDGSTALVPANSEDQSSVYGLQSRFVGAGSSTRAVHTDKDMMDYVDRAMAERNKSATPINKSKLSDIPTSDNSDEYTSASEDDIAPQQASTTDKSNPIRKELPTQHLSEVDLGPTATTSNLARTTAALTGQILHEAPPKKPRRRKPRLGRDGKPLRPRPRKGPEREDLARGALVEAVLNERGLGSASSAYEAQRSAPTGVVRASGVDEAADERMAAEFQQQFLDAMAEKQEKQQQRQGQSAGLKKDAAGQGASQGPRLGGSRSARAKMAAAQAAVGTEKK